MSMIRDYIILTGSLIISLTEEYTVMYPSSYWGGYVILMADTVSPSVAVILYGFNRLTPLNSAVCADTQPGVQ